MLWIRRLVADLSPLGPAFDPGPVLVGFVVDTLALRQVSFRPHRTSVFSCNCRPAGIPYYAALNRRTSGRNLGVFKQAMPCRISGSVRHRSTFTLPFVSCFSVLLFAGFFHISFPFITLPFVSCFSVLLFAGFFHISCSLLLPQHSIFCLSPISAFY